MANTFDWIEIHVRDIERAAAFYEELFGWSVAEKETADGTDCWILDTGGTPQGSSFRAYFSDPDGNVVGLWEENNVA